jgi:ribonuclease HIII
MAHSVSVKTSCQNVIYQAKVLRQTIIGYEEGELAIQRGNSHQMKDIWVPG